MNASMTGSIVLVSALFPSNADTMSGNPSGAGEQADGDLRLQPPLLGEPALPEPVSRIGLEIQGGHVVEHQARRAQPRVRGAGRGDLLPPRVLRERAQPPRHGPVRDRRDAGFLQHPRAVELADRLDDPGQHQLEEHLVPARRLVEPQHPVAVLQASSRQPIRDA